MRVRVHLLHHQRVRPGVGLHAGCAALVGVPSLCLPAPSPEQCRPGPTPARRASDKCLRERRKTITGDDLLWAMNTLGFDDYIEPLKLYLSKFREVCACVLGVEREGGREGE